MLKQTLVSFLVATMLALTACGSHIDRDNEIRQKFFAHRAEFQKVGDALLAESEPYIWINFDFVDYQYSRPRDKIKRINHETFQLCQQFMHKLGYQTIEKKGELIAFRVADAENAHKSETKYLEYEKNRFKNTGEQNSEIVDKKAIGPEGYSAITPDWGIHYFYDSKDPRH